MLCDDVDIHTAILLLPYPTTRHKGGDSAATGVACCQFPRLLLQFPRAANYRAAVLQLLWLNDGGIGGGKSIGSATGATIVIISNEGKVTYFV
jgi:hypothetical protein